MTVPGSLRAPEPKEVLPAEAVEGLLQALQDELDALERELARAQDAARVTTDEALSAPDPTLNARATEFVEVFLATLAATTDRELDDEFAAARAEAGARVAAAEAQADKLLADARSSIADAARHLMRGRASGDAPLGVVALPSPTAWASAGAGAEEAPAWIAAVRAPSEPLQPATAPVADDEPVDDLAARLAGAAAQAFSREALPWTSPGPGAPALDEPVDDLAARLAGAAAQAFRPAVAVVSPPPDLEPGRGPMIETLPPAGGVYHEPLPSETDRSTPDAPSTDEYEEFWEEGEAATKARRRFLAPIRAVVPMVVLVVLVVLFLAWVG